MSYINKYSIIFFLMVGLSAIKSNAQCDLSIVNLPDSILLCKNTTVQLNTTVSSLSGSIVPTDTTWSPATGLSNIHVLNPFVSVGTASTEYVLTVTAVTPSNFVNNGNFSLDNTGFSSNYTYVAPSNNGVLVPEGLYTLTNNPSNVHNAFASFGDHTTGTGEMMVINGASTPVDIWCQTINVSPNTDYDFSAWGASCTPSNPAQLQFEINNVLLGSSLQLPGVNGQWTEFHLVWNSGANTSITICIYDQQVAAGGNDFAIDDISFKQICTVADSVYMNVINVVPSISQVIKLGCAQDTVVFTSVNTGTPPDRHKWDFGDGNVDTSANPTHIYTSQGQYTIKLYESRNGCSDSAFTTVDTRHPLSVGFAPDHDSICATQTITFTNSDVFSSGPFYFWDFGDGTTDSTANPAHTYNTAGLYTVTHAITDKVPCSDTERIQVYVAQAPTLTLHVLNDSICEGAFIGFNTDLFPGYDSVIWNFGDGANLYNVSHTQHAYDQPGTYSIMVTATYPQCPEVSVTKNISVFALPHVNLGPDTSMCPYSDPVLLFNHYVANSSNVRYIWNTGDTLTSTLATQPGIYWLQATAAGGCAASDSIEVLKSCYIDVPNAFTPNGDGTNDYFFPRQFLTRQLVKFHMEIYDRWGQEIFATDNLSGRGWDGNFNNKPQPDGVYIYMIDAQLEGLPEEKLKGNVTLIR